MNWKEKFKEFSKFESALFVRGLEMLIEASQQYDLRTSYWQGDYRQLLSSAY